MRLISILAGLLFIVSALAIAQESSPTSTANVAALSGIQDTNPPPPDFVEVEKEPTVLSRKEPVYPELALRAGIEGKVWVKIWITAEGKPKEVQLLKSDNDVFNQSAIDAARQFVFTPAMKDGKPVAVWVSIPFNFKIWKEPEEWSHYVDVLRTKISKPTVVVVRGPKQIQDLVRYPQSAIDNGIQGTVFATLVLSDSLTISSLKITHGLERNCDRAVFSGIAAYDFAGDKELAERTKQPYISVVVQFILPAKK